ncbi:MAG TPA: hypothetical protein VMR97_02320 [Acidimicrobiales bacterium]|nr:hypothetical protein [Acidimicrobiales bacterium]
MAQGRRLNVMVKWPPAMSVTRLAGSPRKLCYVVTANKIVAYSTGRSKVVYIGATDEGLTRLVNAVSARTEEILANHDLTHFEAHVVSCKAVPRVDTWRKLERALLLTFRDLYGQPPLCNRRGAGIQEEDEFTYFTRERIRNVLEDLG